jgi:LPS-assembly protein
VTTLAALAAAGLLAQLAAADPPPPGPRDVQDVQIEGDVTFETATGRLLVENGAVLRRGAVVIRARSATYDPATGEVRAAGRVLLTERTRVVGADALRAVLGGEWEAEGVIAFVKDEPVDLAEVTDLEAARRAGRNRLSFSGSRLRGDGTDRFALEGARLTLCDCPGGGAPSWEVTARRADVEPGRRAILSWPVLRITPRFLLVRRPVPVLVLPWLYLPLGERQTGLLIPEVRSPYATGFALAQPLFVTLGRSADATLAPDYAFGRGSAAVARGDPSVRGPGARLELRWAPAVAAAGHVEIAWVRDLDAEPGGEAGDRFALAGRHAQRLSERTSVAATLQLAGDPVWVRDFTTDVNQRAAPYRRSDVLVSRAGDALVLEGGASYLQPLQPEGRVPGAPYGAFGADLGVASRWPGASATLLPSAAGPLRIAGRAGAARYAPMSGSFDREGRAAASRADARAELSLPLLAGGAVSFTPYVRAAAAAYAFEADVRSMASVWGVAGGVLETELSRRFGAILHAIAPRLEWRAGTGAAGDPLPWLAYDAFDRSGTGLLATGPPGAWQQLRASVETSLATPAARMARLELGQDVDLRRRRFAETFVAASGGWGLLAADASARFLALDDRADPASEPPIPSPLLDRFTELRASVSLRDRRGGALRAGFFAVGPGGSGTLLAGLDPLFDLRPSPRGGEAFASAGATLVAGAATVGYDVVFPGRESFAPACRPGDAVRQVQAWHVRQHAASFAWDSPCRCFRIVLLASVDDCARGVRDGSYRAAIDLSRLAGARTLR